MKLIRLRLHSPFRSLPAGFKIEFPAVLAGEKILPICLVGLNGSGKSNLLELLSEIFYYLDCFHLDYAPASHKEQKDFGFEIEFALPTSIGVSSQFNISPSAGKYFFVKIIKEPSEVHQYFYRATTEESWQGVDNVHSLALLPLPRKVLAYTSGQNELLSNPYLKIQFHYFHQFEEMHKRQMTYLLEDSRMYFMDQQNNAAILVANFLLNEPSKLNILNKETGVTGLHSFRISIHIRQPRKGQAPINQNIQLIVDRLKKCATLWFEKGSEKDKTVTLDFYVDEALKAAFQDQYGGAFQLFQSFYILEILNLQLNNKATRKLVRNAPKWLNISDELARSDPSNLLFRIEKIRVYKSGVKKPIYYKGLSDGEHQLLQILGAVMMMEQDGCLFLFDEPETHYNPVWRSKLVSRINDVSKIKSKGKTKDVRLQEIFITTHSPFIISDSRREDVYIFYRDKNRKVKYRKPKIQTYGASVGFLMEEIFEKDETIADMPFNEIQQLKKRAKTLEDIEKIKEEMLKFGESIEKFDMYSFLNQRKKELGG